MMPMLILYGETPFVWAENWRRRSTGSMASRARRVVLHRRGLSANYDDSMGEGDRVAKVNIATRTMKAPRFACAIGMWRAPRGLFRCWIRAPTTRRGEFIYPDIAPCPREGGEVVIEAIL